jgi:hypothetical protein
MLLLSLLSLEFIKSLYLQYIAINNGIVKTDIKCMNAVNIIDSGNNPPANDRVGVACGILNKDVGLG